MGSAEIFVLSAALGMDLFSVAIPIGMQRLGRGIVLRASMVFAAFHIAMLLTGYYVGRYLGMFIDQMSILSGSATLMMENCAGLIGALVLAGLGISMLRESFGADADGERRHGDSLRGWALLALAFSVSVDAMAVGVSFGMMEVDLVKVNLILGAVIFLISSIGLSIGRQAGRFLGCHSERLGGIALLGFGLHILWRLFV